MHKRAFNPSGCSVLAINGSPKGPGNTDRILQHFLEGARNAGAKTETIYLKNMEVKHCLGCFSCWKNRQNTCVIKDDMPDMLNKLSQANIVVYATPLYFFSVPGLMKDFLDRALVLHLPYMGHRRKNGYFKPFFNPNQESQESVLISSCGFPGGILENFQLLVETFKKTNRLVAAILRTQGQMLSLADMQETLKPYFDAVRQAGFEVITAGAISEETQKSLNKDLVSTLDYVERANTYWQKTRGDKR